MLEFEQKCPMPDCNGRMLILCHGESTACPCYTCSQDSVLRCSECYLTEEEINEELEREEQAIDHMLETSLLFSRLRAKKRREEHPQGFSAMDVKAKMQDPQPIENAPQDGTVILTEYGFVTYHWLGWVLCHADGWQPNCADHGPFLCEPKLWVPLLDWMKCYK